jgi:hypothetical protein
MADAVPHPLVAGLVQQLLKRRVKGYDHSATLALAQKLFVKPTGKLKTAIQNVDTALQSAQAVPAGDMKTLKDDISTLLNKPPDTLDDKERKSLAGAAEDVDIPDLVTLAGYVGGTVDVKLRGRDEEWWIFYLDSQVQNWRLIPDEHILLHYSVEDDHAPFKKRDVIWLDADAFTASGEAPPRPEVQAKFLRGDFTRAGDLVAPTPAGPSSPSTGVFCDATTPSCCTKTVRH